MIPAVALVFLSQLAIDPTPRDAVAVSPDGRRILTLSPNGDLRTFDATTGEEQPAAAGGFVRRDTAPVLTATGAAALLVPRSSDIRLRSPGINGRWDALDERRSTAAAVGFSADGKAIAAAFRLDSGTTRVRVRKNADAEFRHLAAVGGHVHALAPSAEGDWLLVLSHDRPEDKAVLRTTACQLFDMGTGRPLWSRDEAFRYAVITADDRHAVLTGGPKAMPNRVLDLPDGESCRDRRPPAFDILGPPVVSADGETLFGLTADAIVLWDLTAGRERRRLPVKGVDSSVRMMAVSPDGAFLATTFDGLRKWDVATGRMLFGPPQR